MKNRFPLLFLLCAAFSLLLTSCNTFIGMGRDFQRAGQGLENVGYGRNF